MMCSLKLEPRIETARLILRPMRETDVVRLAEAIDDIDIARMTSRIPHPYSLSAAEAFYASQREALDERLDHTLQIETRSGELIGAVGADRRDGPFPEIGYWIAKAHWGRGYATEAAMAMRDWTRRTFGYRAIMAGHFADNPASGRVLIKCGFLYTGEVRQRFSLARGEEAATRMMVWLA
jgi:RimJ/RimL family protein N-acetyltransferase